MRNQKPPIVLQFIRACVADNWPKDQLTWDKEKREFTCPIINAMFVGYRLCQKDVLNHKTNGHFLIGKMSDSGMVFGNHPKIHYKYGKGRAELDRLSKENPSETFVLYQSVLIYNFDSLNKRQGKEMSHEDKFTVHVFYADEMHRDFPNDKGELYFPAKEAVEMSKKAIDLGKDDRGEFHKVLIVDKEDYAVFEWNKAKGIVFPPPVIPKPEV